MSSINEQKDKDDKTMGQIESLPSLVMNEEGPKNVHNSNIDDEENFVNADAYMAELERRSVKISLLLTIQN